MTPKHHNHPRGLLGLFTGLAAMAGLGNAGAQAPAPPRKTVTVRPPAAGGMGMPGLYVTRGPAGGTPRFTHHSQKKCRKLNRRSGIHRARRAKV